jgi:predicted polyphosphate/ATP-dependent NAD kinase
MGTGEYYLIGPGTTAGAVMEELKLPETLLGVDVIRDKKIVKLDCSEWDLLEIMGERSAKLVIGLTGGQGYLLGRGNQQVSPAVLRKIGKENIIVVSVNSKIIDLEGRPLLIDTGDEGMNRALEGYYRIKVGYGSDIMYRVSAGQ